MRKIIIIVTTLFSVVTLVKEITKNEFNFGVKFIDSSRTFENKFFGKEISNDISF